MGTANKLLQAASGGAGDSVYVEDVFSTFLYAGNDSTNQIQNGLDLSGEGGMVWIKSRSSGSMNHKITDTERGVNKNLTVNYNYAQDTDPSINSFNSDGFTLNTSYSDWNDTGHDYVAWTWRKQPGFFDVVTYTGNDTAGRTISHNLDSVPGMIIIKCSSHSNEHWYVYHRGMDSTAPEDYNLKLNQNIARTDENQMLNDTAPTSTEFTVAGFNATNGTGKSYVAYLFAHDDQRFGDDSDEAIIKCGSYTGNGSSTGPEVNVGFEPQFLIVKAASRTGSWLLLDMMRGIVTGPSSSSGGQDNYLIANTSGAEGGTTLLNVTSTGFQPETHDDAVNENGATYIYIAIRRPMKAPEYGTDVFAASAGGSSGLLTFDTNFRVDFNWLKGYTTTSVWYANTRLTGERYIAFDSNNQESSLGINWDRMTGWQHTSTGDYSAYFGWSFKRAKGFLDIVAYTSNTTYPNTFNHNLGVVPELILIKRRDGSSPWAVYSAPLGNNKHLVLSSTAGEALSTYWNNTTPTSTVVSVGGQDEIWGYGGYTYIAYLFATVAGVSKVGSYSGTGSTINVDCGFSAGARFVLIKRTDDTGNWFLYDSVRGIVAGADPYLLLNSTAAQDSSNDDIDPLSSGFSIPSGSNVNTNGASYIFLAIA